MLVSEEGPGIVILLQFFQNPSSKHEPVKKINRALTEKTISELAHKMSFVTCILDSMITAVPLMLATLLVHPVVVSLHFGNIQSPQAKTPEVAMSIPETNYVFIDYGVWLTPKKLIRRERLALALTKLAEPWE